MKTIISCLFCFNCFLVKSQVQVDSVKVKDTSFTILKSKTGIQFGTIAKLEVKVINGSDFKIKDYQSILLLEILKVNDFKVKEKHFLKYVDETNTINEEMKNLIGKKLTLFAYETGSFTGIPKDYFEYRPVIASKNFHFENKLVILKILND